MSVVGSHFWLVCCFRSSFCCDASGFWRFFCGNLLWYLHLSLYDLGWPCGASVRSACYLYYLGVDGVIVEASCLGVVLPVSLLALRLCCCWWNVYNSLRVARVVGRLYGNVDAAITLLSTLLLTRPCATHSRGTSFDTKTKLGVYLTFLSVRW